MGKPLGLVLVGVGEAVRVAVAVYVAVGVPVGTTVDVPVIVGTGVPDGEGDALGAGVAGSFECKYSTASPPNGAVNSVMAPQMTLPPLTVVPVVGLNHSIISVPCTTLKSMSMDPPPGRKARYAAPGAITSARQ